MSREELGYYANWCWDEAVRCDRAEAHRLAEMWREKAADLASAAMRAT